MQQVAYVIAKVVEYLILIMQLLVVARSLVMFIPADDENKLADFIYGVSEPIVMPAQLFLDKFEGTKNSPFDFSGILTILVLFVIEILLPSF